jgi:2-polyprenyl-3-methyl-5-hydroxy-6-metoxy-1,4-benzoquinol methylase
MKILYVGLKQRLKAQLLERQPEMDVVMYDQEQDEQFTRDGEEGSLAVLYELIVDTLRKLAPDSGRALDLGCGSGQLLCKIAAALPELHFTGLDLSANMLRFAERSARELAVANVDFVQGSWFELEKLEAGPFDLITWHLALHHCDTAADVRRVVDSATDRLAPGGAIFLFDIVRPKTGRLAVHLADMYSLRWGSWFYQDTLDSYKAAFSFEELEEILRDSKLKGYRHVEPVFFNFWQMAYVSHGARKQRPPRRSHLRRWWQRRDLAMLRACFAGRV